MEEKLETIDGRENDDVGDRYESNIVHHDDGEDDDDVDGTATTTATMASLYINIYVCVPFTGIHKNSASL